MKMELSDLTQLQIDLSYSLYIITGLSRTFMQYLHPIKELAGR
jgi:hypothetical protein